jgi:hypothetical protein
MTLPHHHNGTEYAVKIKPDRTTFVFIKGQRLPEFGTAFPRGTKITEIMEWVKLKIETL